MVLAKGALLLVSILIYIAVLGEVGFIAASAVVFAVLMVLFGARNPVGIVVTSVVVPVVLFGLFTYGFPGHSAARLGVVLGGGATW